MGVSAYKNVTSKILLHSRAPGNVERYQEAYYPDLDIVVQHNCSPVEDWYTIGEKVSGSRIINKNKFVYWIIFFQKNAITGNDEQHVYIGESGVSVGVRMRDHNKNAKNQGWDVVQVGVAQRQISKRTAWKEYENVETLLIHFLKNKGINVSNVQKKAPEALEKVIQGADKKTLKAMNQLVKVIADKFLNLIPQEQPVAPILMLPSPAPVGAPDEIADSVDKIKAEVMGLTEKAAFRNDMKQPDGTKLRFTQGNTILYGECVEGQVKIRTSSPKDDKSIPCRKEESAGA
jgi:hypothetical protein